MMASDGGTDKLDDIESVPENARSTVVKNRKRRLDNEKQDDEENKCDADNDFNQKSKKTKKNPSKTVSASEEPTPAPAIAAQNSFEEVCSTFGLNDVKIQYSDVDYQNLSNNYKFFTKHVRPILAKENPKVPVAEISILVSAKWREFSSQKPELSEQTAPVLPRQSAADSRKEEKPTVLEVCTAYDLKDVEIQYRKIDNENLTNYKSFSRYVRPILSKENPKAPASKIMMLASAKWREFSSQKLALTEPTLPSPPPSPVVDPEKEVLPTVQEVCVAYDLKDVKMEYDAVGDDNLTDYRSFTRHIRPILSENNPKAPASKILMLVAAKWREFYSQRRLDDQTESDENKENEENNYASKPARSRATKRKTRVNDDICDANEEKIENRVTRARSGQNKKNTKSQKKVSARPKV